MRVEGEPLPGDETVYRALRAKKWREDGKLHEAAFLLRENEPEGASVSGCPYNATKVLDSHHGAAEFQVEPVRAVCDDAGQPLGLDVVANPDLAEGRYHDPEHALVKDLPLWAPPEDTDGVQRALEAARVLVRQVEFRLLARDDARLCPSGTFKRDRTA